MRRTIVLLMVAVAVVLTIAGGVVLAAPVGCTGVDCIGTREADTITGSDSFDRIAGMEGNDIISGRHGSDQIFGDEGNDTIEDGSTEFVDSDEIYGDEGNDLIDVQDGGSGPDTVNCGPGKKDKVFFDQGSDTLKGCEIKKPGQA